jgi:hypothetical protein
VLSAAAARMLGEMRWTVLAIRTYKDLTPAGRDKA